MSAQPVIETRGSFLRRHLIEVLLMVSGLALGLGTSVVLSPTTDEAKHIKNGLGYLRDKTCCINDEAPFSAFHALFLPDLVSGQTTLDLSLHLFRARLPTLFFYLLTAVLVWKWTESLTSTRAARCSLAVALFSPDLLAHAGLATEDMFLASLATATMFSFWYFSRNPTLLRALLVAIVCGISLLTKASAIVVYASLLSGFLLLLRYRGSAPSISRPRNLLAIFAILTLVPPLLLNSGYFFRGSFDRLEQFPAVSHRFQSLQHTIAGKIPLPVPHGFVKTFDSMNRDSEVRKKTGYQTYLFGQYYPDGSPLYFLAAILVKTSTAILLPLVAGLYFLLQRHRDPIVLTSLLVFPISFLLINSFFNASQVGIRYILAAYPFLFVIAGYAFDAWGPWRWAAMAVIPLSLQTFPNYLSFFNLSSRLIPKEDMLIDSNLDWGQMNFLIEQDSHLRDQETAICTLLPAATDFYGIHTSRYPKDCTFYVSRSAKKLSRHNRGFYDVIEPNDTLAGIIDVYEFADRTASRIRVVSSWQVMPPFEAGALNRQDPFVRWPAASTGQEIAADFGTIDIARVFPGRDLRGWCVGLESTMPLSGRLLLAADEELFVDQRNGNALAASGNGTLGFADIEFPVANQPVRLIACNTTGGFMIHAAYQDR